MTTNLATNSNDLVGSIIDAGSLKVLGILGSGAHGTVYRVVSTASEDATSFFAVKSIVQADVQSKDRFVMEFTLHSCVSRHPNIVTLHRLFEDPDSEIHFAVMELVPCGDLFAAISNGNIYKGNTELLKEAFLEILDAVEFCHENGIFHRDLKPENILCSEDGKGIKLADFGLATTQRSSRDFGTGTPPYQSPECLAKDSCKSYHYIHLHSDIWSLGMILINMICSSNPWENALSSDTDFSAYSAISRAVWFEMVLPVSSEASIILRRILKIDPVARISIKGIRKKILAVKTFFKDEVVEDNSPGEEAIVPLVENLPQSVPLPMPEKVTMIPPPLDLDDQKTQNQVSKSSNGSVVVTPTAKESPSGLGLVEVVNSPDNNLKAVVGRGSYFSMHKEEDEKVEQEESKEERGGKLLEDI